MEHIAGDRWGGARQGRIDLSKCFASLVTDTDVALIVAVEIYGGDVARQRGGCCATNSRGWCGDVVAAVVGTLTRLAVVHILKVLMLLAKLQHALGSHRLFQLLLERDDTLGYEAVTGPPSLSEVDWGSGLRAVVVSVRVEYGSPCAAVSGLGVRGRKLIRTWFRVDLQELMVGDRSVRPEQRHGGSTD